MARSDDQTGCGQDQIDGAYPRGDLVNGGLHGRADSVDVVAAPPVDGVEEGVADLGEACGLECVQDGQVFTGRRDTCPSVGIRPSVGVRLERGGQLACPLSGLGFCGTPAFAETAAYALATGVDLVEIKVVSVWDAWYSLRQEAMRADPLLKYFAELRTQIEKQGLLAAMAEVVDVESGVTIADVACGKDEFGIWTAGVARRDPNGDLTVEPVELERNRLMLRNFRLADPPTSHLGHELTDLRFTELAGRVIAYLREHVLSPAF